MYDKHYKTIKIVKKKLKKVKKLLDEIININ